MIVCHLKTLVPPLRLTVQLCCSTQMAGQERALGGGGVQLRGGAQRAGGPGRAEREHAPGHPQLEPDRPVLARSLLLQATTPAKAPQATMPLFLASLSGDSAADFWNRSPEVCCNTENESCYLNISMEVVLFSAKVLSFGLRNLLRHFHRQTFFKLLQVILAYTIANKCCWRHRK